MFKSRYGSLYGVSIIWVRIKFFIQITFIKNSIRQVATKKPGVDDFYVKNVYSEIADYPKRKVPY